MTTPEQLPISELEIDERIEQFDMADEPIDDLLSGGASVDELLAAGLLDDDIESPEEREERLQEVREIEKILSSRQVTHTEDFDAPYKVPLTPEELDLDSEF